MADFQKESLSLEETNKLRISLGLKPLTDDDAAPASKGGDKEEEAPVDADKLAEQNYARHREQEAKEKDARDIKAKIAKAQNRRDLAKRLAGRGLGDTGEDEEEDARQWIKKSKKRAKENAAAAAARLAKEMEERDRAALENTYGEKDLTGLKVAHDLNEIDDGTERILTLKDSRILEGQDDELEDTTLAALERDVRNRELKKGARGYTGFDDDEFAEGQIGKKRAVLSKYDVELEAEKSSGFVLGAAAPPKPAATELATESAENKGVNRKLLALDYIKNQERSDYLQEGDVGFKKYKTKKRKSARKVTANLDDEATPGGDIEMADANGHAASAENGDGMEVDGQSAPRLQSENFVDDDELQAALSKARRLKARKAIKKVSPEEIARNLAEQREAERKACETSSLSGVMSPAVGVGSADDKEEGGGGGLTFDDTSEFVRHLAMREQPQRTWVPPTKAVKQEPGVSPPTTTDEREGTSSRAVVDGVSIKKEPQNGDVALTEFDSSALPPGPSVKEEGEADEEEADDAMDALMEGASRDVEPTSAEQLVAGGLAATLNVLRSQGVAMEVTPEQKEREKKQKEQDRWKAEHMVRVRAKEAERAQSKAQGASKDQQTREMENRQREAQEARDALAHFKDYKPDFDIKYHDEFGRELNHKEAWKMLSHRFHGRMPGKAKQELRLKRIEEERKRAAMASGDTVFGMNAAFQNRQGRTGSAHMVLSVGNKGSAPSESELLSAPPSKTSKEKGAGKGKGKSEGGERSLRGLGAPMGGLDASSALSANLSPSVFGYPTASGLASGTASGMQSVLSGGSGSATPAGAGGAGWKSVSAAPERRRDSRSPSAGPTMRPSFAPVTAAAAASSPASGSTSVAQGSGGTPGPGGGGFKLSFGAKRKAMDEGGEAGSTPEKKRR